MASLWHHVFTVVGDGPFPIDMLRYDACYPADQESVSSMIVGCSPRPQAWAKDGERLVRVAKVSASKTWTPTEGRWRSFGWNVSPGTHRVQKGA